MPLFRRPDAERPWRSVALEVGDRSRAGSTVRVGRTYLNGWGERSYTDPGDLNVPLRLECELLGRDPWLGKAAG